MSIEHHLARLTAQSPSLNMLPGGGAPGIKREDIAQAAASLDDSLAYHLVMGAFTDSIISKNHSLRLIEKESERIWNKNRRGKINKQESFTLLTILAHAIYFQNPEGKRKITATQKAHFCRLSESAWHAKWGAHFHDLMVCISAREGGLLRWISNNIHREK